MTESNLLATLALLRSPNIGDILAKRLIRHFGSAEAIFKSKKRSIAKIDGIGLRLVHDLFNPHNFLDAEQEMKFIADQNISCCYFLEDDYPERLKHCIDGPVLLFRKGHINLANKPVISIVGTRQITTRGKSFCRELIDCLSVYNPVIVSGFAYGTDIIAQKTAMEKNVQTIGCLAHGFEQIYPKSHAQYVNSIMANGGFYTEFWSTDTFERTNFIKRNRIIAGISEATIVIESAEKGGSLITAGLARSYDREVFALPGRPTDPYSVGCNNLIKSQQAMMLTQPEDIPYIMNWHSPELLFPPVAGKPAELTQNEKIVYDDLTVKGRCSLDDICRSTSLQPKIVAGLLLSLELKGLIIPLPGKTFEIKN